MELSINVSGIDGLDKDFQAFQQKLGHQVKDAVAAMEAPLKDDLAVHIEHDVYDAYTPKEYPRRRDNPDFGIPLIDMDANVTYYNKVDGPTFFDVGGGLSFSYKPDGSHSGTTADLPNESDNYDADNPESIKPKPVHGDDLIRRIETGEGYDWKFKGKGPGKREFWQKFVNEEMDGRMAQHFANAMRAQGVEDLQIDWSDVVREEGDGSYEGSK